MWESDNIKRIKRGTAIRLLEHTNTEQRCWTIFSLNIQFICTVQNKKQNL